MRNIKISEEVWQYIADNGKFGETEDDVLHRLFNLENSTKLNAAGTIGRRGRGNTRFATKRMSHQISNGQLILEFDDGARMQWLLPKTTDKAGIRKLRDAAVDWALQQGASDPGQTNAVRKALTSAGYFVSR